MKQAVHVSFRCEATMEREIRVEAAKNDMNRSEFILEALREKLDCCDDPQHPKRCTCD